jgi:hypothetical protein
MFSFAFGGSLVYNVVKIFYIFVDTTTTLKLPIFPFKTVSLDLIYLGNLVYCLYHTHSALSILIAWISFTLIVIVYF